MNRYLLTLAGLSLCTGSVLINDPAVAQIHIRQQGDEYLILSANRDSASYYYNDLNRIYQDVLGRNIDINGFRTYADRLERGWSRYWVRRDITRSPESQAAINRIYRQVLGRDADPSGLRTYRSRLQHGWSLQDVYADIASSQEAQAN